MKHLIKIFIPVILMILVSCEDVIELELEESQPRLVVEASLVWDADRPETPYSIRLTTTAPYFSEEVPAAIGATVNLYGPNGEEYFFEEEEPGIFQHESFAPEENADYELQVTYDSEEYRATERMATTPKLEYIEQIDNGGFIGDEIELRAYFNDPAETENYYLFQFYHDRLSLQLGNDKFTNGNTTFTRFSDEELAPGDMVSIKIQGITQRFYEYMYLLLSQSGDRGGPFQTQPTTVRGNIVNITNPDNFAFGYFRISESHLLSYRIQ